MQNKKAFTLGEMLICLAVIGSLYLIITPIMARYSPKSDKIMFRKAYNTIEKTIYEMINDDSIYPDVYLGFADDTPVSGEDKFCHYFFDYLNTIDDSSASTCDKKTTDGIRWQIYDIKFKNGSEPFNGFSTTIKATVKDNKNFRVKVRYDGKIKIPTDSDATDTEKELVKLLENPLANN